MNQKDMTADLRRAVPAFFAAAAFVAAALAGIVFIHHRADVPYGDLTRDPSIILHGQLTSGILSTIGGLVWAMGVGIALLAAAASAGNRPEVRFFLWSAAFTTWLMGDDVFLFHEKLFPVYLGVPEIVFHAAYPLFALAWIVVFRRRILLSPWPLAFAAFGFLALSELLDVCSDGREQDIRFLLEDGAKFAGIMMWSTYLLIAGRDAVKPVQNVR